MGAPEGAKPRVQGKPGELRPQNGPERLPRPPQHPRCTTRPLVRTLATQVFIPVGCVIVHTWFKVCSGPIYHGLSTPDDRCVGRHGTPSTRTHRPASAGAAGGHHKAPGWGGLSSQPKKAHICRQSSSFARRQLSRGPPRRGCRTAEVRLPRSSVTAGLRALAPPPKPSTASGRASAVQRSVLNSAVQASLE